MNDGVWRFLIKKGLDKPTGYFFSCHGIQICIAMRGQLWDYTDFFCYIWATGSDWDCIWHGVLGSYMVAFLPATSI
jgi:hypothetical protein